MLFKTTVPRRLTVGLACSATLLLAACGTPAEEANTSKDGGADSAAASSSGGGLPKIQIPADLKDKKPIVIGAAIAHTGLEAPYDLPAATTAAFAIDDINAKGGVLGRPLTMATADTRSDRSSSRATLEVIGDGAEVGLVSCDLDFGAPDAVEFGNKKMVAMSLCAATPTFGPQRVGPLAFSAGVATNNEAAGGAEFAVKKGWKSAYLLTDTALTYTKSWSGYFDEAFRSLGGKIVGRDTLQMTDTSFQTQVTRLAKVKDEIDVIAACTVPPGGPTLVRQLRAAGIDKPIVACIGMSGTRWLRAVPNLKDFYVTDLFNFSGEDTDEKINELHARYVEATGEEPSNGQFTQGYGAIELLARGIEKAGTTNGKELAAALETFKDEQVLTGPTTYSKDWHVPMSRPVTIQEIADGKPKLVERLVPTHVPEP